MDQNSEKKIPINIDVLRKQLPIFHPLIFGTSDTAGYFVILCFTRLFLRSRDEQSGDLDPSGMNPVLVSYRGTFMFLT